jgi:Family of unknown function (DUF6356)
MEFQHLKDHNVTYYEHFKHAWSIIYKLSCCNVKLFVHSLYPDMFKTDTTDTLRAIIAEHDAWSLASQSSSSVSS